MLHADRSPDVILVAASRADAPGGVGCGRGCAGVWASVAALPAADARAKRAGGVENRWNIRRHAVICVRGGFAYYFISLSHGSEKTTAA